VGQPWGYPVLDPKQYLRRFVGDDDTGPFAFLRARATKLFAELDAVRVEHPHGLVCPWVYDGDARDPLAAVVAGARLFETPASAEHAALAELAIVRPDQIDPHVPPHDDAHVLSVTPAQLTEYERLIEVIMECAREGGRGPSDVLCEVPSTCPAPLAAVMKQYDLGRFRVTQKASTALPDDGDRGENAAPHDWIMIGNHDTPPLRATRDSWRSGCSPTSSWGRRPTCSCSSRTCTARPRRTTCRASSARTTGASVCRAHSVRSTWIASHAARRWM
jgi:hypothetical protein